VTVLDHTFLTTAALVEAFAGREGTGLRVLRDAAAQIEESIRQRIVADAQSLGIDPGDMLAKMLSPAAATPAPEKRTRTAKARPEAPADDAELLKLLLAAIGDDRVGHKGLAGRFAGLDIDRVRRVLADEASRGAEARVKLEPNGRTWVRVKP
jgi:hypothetical protein